VCWNGTVGITRHQIRECLWVSDAHQLPFPVLLFLPFRTIYSVWFHAVTWLDNRQYRISFVMQPRNDGSLYERLNWPCPPIDSIMRLMTVWRITGKIIRTVIFDTYAQLWSAVLTTCVSVVCCVLCFIKVKLSVQVKLFVPLLCVCAILPAKAVPEMTYTVSGGTLNPTQSLTHSLNWPCSEECCCLQRASQSAIVSNLLSFPRQPP